MNILIVSVFYEPELGAAPSRITNMAKGLVEHGANVDVLTALPNYPKGEIFEDYQKKFCCRESMDGIEVFRYWTYATISKNPLLRLISMFAFSLTMWAFIVYTKRIHRYDIVVVQSPPIMIAVSAILLFKKIFRKKVVLNVSDLWPASAVELGAVREGSPFYRVLAWMERFIYNHSDGIQGQSRVILEHIKDFVPHTPQFLYRNLQHTVASAGIAKRREPFRIVYAGLMGVAQDLYSIIRNINFKSMGAELHLYGGGNQVRDIQQYIEKHDISVFYHGFLDKEMMVAELQKFDASLVPLAVQIKGAVPSKIFDLLPVGVPILLCGGGEAAEIVNNYNIGLISEPDDHEQLKTNIITLIKMDVSEYEGMRKNCIMAANNDFSFEKQINRYNIFLSNILS